MNEKPVDSPQAPGVNAPLQEATPMLSPLPIPATALLFPLAPPFGKLAGEGVNEMTKPAQFKVGLVSVKEGWTPTRGASFWELRYTDPGTGKEVKRRVSGLDRDEVKAIADHLNRQAYAGKGYLPNRPKAPTLEDGLLEAIRLSRGNEKSKADGSHYAKHFLAFMVRQYPGARTWGEVRPGMVESYVRELEHAGKAHDTIRNALKPVRAAWRRMHADYSELVKAPAPLRLTPRPQHAIECLEASEVVALLDWIKVHRPALWPMACLQGLCGLRTWEAAFLRVQDVDLDARTVTITKTPRHTPKTTASYRVLPIPSEVMEALKAAIDGQRIRPVSGELFTNDDGDLWKAGALSHRWTFTLRKAARDLDNPRLAAIPARKLRAAFATMAGRLGVQDRILKAYLGHTAGDVLGGHYRRIDLSELRTVSECFENWREAAREEKGRKDFGNIPVSAVANV